MWYGQGVACRRTSEVLQQLDLTQRALSEDLLAEDIGDLLDGHAFTSLVVGRSTAGILSAGCLHRAAYRVLPNNAVCALSQLLGHIVALVDDEFLVEDLVLLSARCR
jgi:hypothetical protein